MKHLITKIQNKIFYHHRFRWNRKFEPIRHLVISNELREKLIQHTNGEFIFLHIPKSAGTSVSEALYDSGYIAECEPGHFTAREYGYVCQGKTLNYIAVLRNPIDRFCSAFNYLRDGGGNKVDNAFQLKNNLNNYENIDDFIIHKFSNKNKKCPVQNWIHFVPQVQFLPLNRKNLNVYSIENLYKIEEDFSIFLKHRNKSKNSMSPTIVGRNARLKLEEFYYEDMSLWQKLL